MQKDTLSRDYVQLAVSILKEPKESNIDPALRDWAVDLLDDNSPTKFSSQIVQQLKSGKIALPINVGTPVSGRLHEYPTAISPDGKRLLWVDQDGNIVLSDLAGGTGRPFYGIAPRTSLAFALDGKTLATGQSDGVATLRDLSTGMEIRRFVHATPIVVIAFSLDGKTLLTAGLDYSVKLGQVETGRLIQEYRPSPRKQK